MGRAKRSNVVRVTSLNLAESNEDSQDEFRLHDLQLRGDGWFGDYARAVFSSLARRGHRVGGAEVGVWSDVPIGAGLSSSAAFEVSVAKLCSILFGLHLSQQEVAEVAYEAEHEIMGIPCGRLDQYASSFGGVLSLQTRPPFRVERLAWPNLTFVIADSEEHRRIASIHPIRQREVEEALRILLDEAGIPKALVEKLGYHCNDPRWENIDESEISPFLPSMPRKLANRLLFTIRMQLSTSYALGILKRKSSQSRRGPASLSPFLGKPINNALSALGAVMDYQHSLLRDLYDVSTPRLEMVRDALIAGGALGAKISGAGLGGAIIGLVRNQRAGQAVKRACSNSGIEKLWVSTPSEGARVETERWVKHSYLEHRFAAKGKARH